MIIKFQTAGDRNSFNSLEQAKQYPVGSKRQRQGDKFPEAESYRRERKSRTENIRSALLKSSDRIKVENSSPNAIPAAAMEMSA